MSILIEKDNECYRVATLANTQWEEVLESFNGIKTKKIITGIFNNPGILTHDVSGRFYCNNTPDIAQNVNGRLLIHDLKVLCVPQKIKNPLTDSHHWYVCQLPSVEV